MLCSAAQTCEAFEDANHMHMLCFISIGSGKGVCWFCHIAPPGSEEDGEERFHIHPYGGR